MTVAGKFLWTGIEIIRLFECTLLVLLRTISQLLSAFVNSVNDLDYYNSVVCTCVCVRVRALTWDYASIEVTYILFSLRLNSCNSQETRGDRGCWCLSLSRRRWEIRLLDKPSHGRYSNRRRSTELAGRRRMTNANSAVAVYTKLLAKRGSRALKPKVLCLLGLIAPYEG